MEKKESLKKAPASDPIEAYIQKQKPENAAISRLLRKQIETHLPKATSKLYHSIPVWFIGENAVIGFSVTAKNVVNLLFWNGQALKEPELKAVGQFKAAQIQFKDVSDINTPNLRRWIKKAGKDIWDFHGLYPPKGLKKGTLKIKMGSGAE